MLKEILPCATNRLRRARRPRRCNEPTPGNLEEMRDVARADADTEFVAQCRVNLGLRLLAHGALLSDPGHYVQP